MIEFDASCHGRTYKGGRNDKNPEEEGKFKRKMGIISAVVLHLSKEKDEQYSAPWVGSSLLLLGLVAKNANELVLTALDYKRYRPLSAMKV